MADYNQLARFNLTNGQYFADYKYKNLWWYLNGTEIGFGDLREDDIDRISVRLAANEEFVGWNEHHTSKWQQTKTPMIRITHDKVIYREEIVEVEGR